MATYLIPFIDYAKEASTVRLPVSDAITDPNITALYNGIADVTLGGEQQSKLETSVAKDGTNSGPAASVFAHREWKWLVSYQDAVTGKKSKAEIPCPDPQELVLNTDLMDLAGTKGLAFVTAFEANVLGADGNASLITQVRLVGRNL